ncbi:MAG: hypothetical protein KAT77_00210 [Nanoarchaeota archaeon]|nr:hypothetical protein [Nanoarchaeota archaeon]
MKLLSANEKGLVKAKLLPSKTLIYLTIFLLLASFAFAQDAAGGDPTGDAPITVEDAVIIYDDKTPTEINDLGNFQTSTTTTTITATGFEIDELQGADASYTRVVLTGDNGLLITVFQRTETIAANTQDLPLIFDINILTAGMDVGKTKTFYAYVVGDGILGTWFTFTVTYNPVGVQPISTGDGGVFTPGPIPESLKTDDTEDKVLGGLLDLIIKQGKLDLKKIQAAEDVQEVINFGLQEKVRNEFGIHDPLEFPIDVVNGATGGDAVIGGDYEWWETHTPEEWTEYYKRQREKGVCECYMELDIEWFCNQEFDGKYAGTLDQGVETFSGNYAPPHGDPCETHSLICGIKCAASADAYGRFIREGMIDRCKSVSLTRSTYRRVVYPLEIKPSTKAKCVVTESVD